MKAKIRILIAGALLACSGALFSIGSQAALYTLGEDLVDKMIAWSKECGGKTDADCSRNLAALRRTAFKAAEWPIEVAGTDADDKNPDGENGWRAHWRLYERLFKYHGGCFNRYDSQECRSQWTAFEKEQRRVTNLYGPEPRWWGFPDALKGRVFTPIPHKHVGEEAAKQWVRIAPGVEAYVKPAEKSEHTYVPNPNLPPDCVEVSSDVKLNPGQDFWTEPPQFKPGNVPDSCVLVKVYQRGALLGWVFMEKSAVERLHMTKAQTASPVGHPAAGR
jgi:hypothetical protein